MSQEYSSVAHYNILERIGEGGLGDVYRARDTKVGRTVALKLAPRGFAEGQRQHRLVDDARAAAALSHPNIAWLFDVGHHDGRLYLAYEFVQGTSFRQHMSNGAMNPRHALDLAVQVADALAEGHSRGVLHKDLRPDTLLETAKGSAKVLDFGMSVWTRGGQTRGLAAAAPGSVTEDALAIVPYMSPEQALGGRVDARTDVFSLGTIVYEMITGKNPFAAAGPGATLIDIIQKVPAAPTALNPDLPKMFDVVLMRALAKDLDKRTESAAKLAADLRRCRSLLESNGGEPYALAPNPAQRRSDILPIEEERGGSGLWWLLGVLGAGMAAAVYYWMR
ncbi:MAG: serine/threonine-protein kinase [Vicinamibacterales bacterium]